MLMLPLPRLRSEISKRIKPLLEDHLGLVNQLGSIIKYCSQERREAIRSAVKAIWGEEGNTFSPNGLMSQKFMNADPEWKDEEPRDEHK